MHRNEPMSTAGSRRGRSTSSSSEPSIPSALGETIISSYRQYRQQYQQQSRPPQHQSESSPVSSFKSAVSQSRSRSRSTTHPQQEMAPSAWPASRQHPQSDAPSQLFPLQDQTGLSLSPPSPTTNGSASSSVSATRSPSPTPTPAEQHLSRSSRSGSAAHPSFNDTTDPRQPMRASSTSEPHSILAALRSRTDQIARKQQQHARENFAREPVIGGGPSRSPSSAAPSSSSSMARPLQQLLLRSEQQLTSRRSASRVTNVENADESDTAQVAVEDQRREPRLSPLTSSEQRASNANYHRRSNSNSSRASSWDAGRETRTAPSQRPSRSSSRDATVASHVERPHIPTEGKASTDPMAAALHRNPADKEAENRFAWQQRLIDAQLRLREEQEQRASLLKQQEEQQQHQPQHASQKRDAPAKAEATHDMDVKGDYTGRSLQRDAEQIQKHLALVDAEWDRRAAAFQSAKENLEADLMEKFLSLRRAEQERLLSSLDDDKRTGSGEHEWQRFLQTHFAAAHKALLEREAQFHEELERRVVEQVAIFTEEYKKVLDEDFATRCQRMDMRVAERDRKWVSILAEERKRLQASEETEEDSPSASGSGSAGESSSRRQQDIVLGAVGEAMQEIAALRDELARDHERQQAKLLKLFMEKRDALNKTHAQALKKQAERVDEMQKECAASVMRCQEEIDRLQAELAAKDVDLTRLSNALEKQVKKRTQRRKPTESENDGAERVSCAPVPDGEETDEEADDSPSAFSARCARIRHDVSRHWQQLFEEQRDEHKTMLRALSDEYNVRVENLRAEQQKRLAELSAANKHQVEEVKRITEAHWAARLADYQKETLAQVEAMKSWEDTNAELRNELRRVHEEMDSLRAASAAQVYATTQSVEAKWREEIAHTRERYDALLTAAALKQQTSVPQEEHARLQDELQSVKLKLVDLTANSQAERDAAVHQVTLEWQARLDAETQRHHEASAALRREYEDKLASWRDSLRAKEEEWHLRTQDSIARLQAHTQQQLEQERAASQALLEEAHSAAEARVSHFIQAHEQGWAKRQETFDASVRATQAELAERADRLRHAEQDLQASVDAAVAQHLATEREALYAQLETDRAALDQEREAAEERGRQLRFKMQREYEDKFFHAKQQLRGQQAAMCAQVLVMAEEREQMLLAAREEETGLLCQHYSTSLKTLAARQYEMGESIREEMAEMFDRGATLVEVQKGALLRDMKDLQEQISCRSEDACRELLEAHAGQLQKRYVAHVEDSNAHWQSLQEYILQRTWQVDEQQRSFEDSLRSHYETLLKEERQRAEDALAEVRQACARQLQEARQEAETEADRRCEALGKTHEEDQARWQTRIEELTAKYEDKLQRQRERLEVIRREHQQALDALRESLDTTHAEDMRTLEENLNAQSDRVRAACEERVQQAIAKEKELRAQFTCDLVAVEKRHLAKNESLQQELHRHFDEQLATLRSELEAKNAALVALEKAQDEAVRARVEAALTDMQNKYDAFVATTQERQLRDAEAHQAALLMAQQAHEDKLITLQQQSEDTLRRFMEQLQEKTATEAAERVKALEEHIRQREAERDAERANNQVLQRELEQLRQAMAPTISGNTRGALLPVSQAAPRDPNDGATRATPRPASAPLLLQSPAPTQYIVASPAAAPLTPLRTPPVITQKTHTDSSSMTYTRAQNQSSRSRLGGFLAPRPINLAHIAAGTPVKRGDEAPMHEAGKQTPNTAPNLSAYLAQEPAWHRLTELWTLLETPAEERAHFKERLMLAWSGTGRTAHAPQANDEATTRDVLLREVARREGQLPLLERFVQRQLLLDQREQQRAPRSGEDDKENGPRSSPDELDVLTEELKTAIPQHEKLFGQTFVFRGQRVMEQIC